MDEIWGKIWIGSGIKFGFIRDKIWDDPG